MFRCPSSLEYVVHDIHVPNALAPPWTDTRVRNHRSLSKWPMQWVGWPALISASVLVVDTLKVRHGGDFLAICVKGGAGGVCVCVCVCV